MAPGAYRASTGELDSREYDRVSFERDRERRDWHGDERVSRHEEDEISISSRRGGPPPRPRDRSPPIDWPPRGSRTFEDDRVVHERRRIVDDDDSSSLQSGPPRRRREPPRPAVIDGDGNRRVFVEKEIERLTMRDRSPPPPMVRPTRLVRRQSSLDTFDRQPARRFHDHIEEMYERTPVRLDDVRTRVDDVYIDVNGGYRKGREHDGFHETRLVHKTSRRRHSRSPKRPSSSSSSSASVSSASVSSGGVALKGTRSEYPKKGKTRMPARLVSERALADLGYPFIREGKTIVVQVALGQDNIDEVLKLSQDYKKSESEMVESKTTKITKITTGGGSRGGKVVEEERREERHRDDVYMTPAMYSPPPMAPPPPSVYAPPPGPPPNYVYQNEVPPPPPQPPQPTEYMTTIKIRDDSPERMFTTAATGPTSNSLALVQPTSRSLAPVVIDAGGPSEYSAYSTYSTYGDDYPSGPATMIVDRRHRRHRSHSHSHSHSRSHSRGDGALYAHVHDGYHHHHHHRDRELVRTERLSTGELVVYEDEVERIVEPHRGVRIEKDKKGPPPALMRAMLATLT
ncbi:hypothetical protein CMQ_3820 [Grosmannia clavigera kw1407]|uniref:DUF8035 domain-containing protein n=1 Tax=Grosmannia clavigera (strain kw1407 / UAMH 11150) TaxID=655863 RepID=F0X9P8_GROCL|nr:uncharacterized protein CMQ_3820 [Grosmannia clavigera kw1407]EFX05751.1 hypothetical protein CMQ_3820 [Grosmannia clavigera kw1407]